MADHAEELRSMLEQKDKEILSLHERQVSSLENKISEQKREFHALQNTFTKLQQDFKYNLGLLDDRDAELAEYDSLLNSIQASLREKEVGMEELKAAMSKDKEEAKICKESMMHRIHVLEQELESFQAESEERMKKQEQTFESSKAEMNRLLLDKEKEVDMFRENQIDRLRKLENEVLVYQWRSDAANMKLNNLEMKYEQLENNLKLFFDENNRNLEEIALDMNKLFVADENLQKSYHENIKRLQDDARLLEQHFIKCISQETEKVNNLSVCLVRAQSQCEEFENTMMERLHMFTRKAQCMENEFLEIREHHLKHVQKIEHDFSETLQLHDTHLKEAKHETMKWQTEANRLQMKCVDLEKVSNEKMSLLDENRQLQQRLLELQDQNERIQKVVEMLRTEMETLQDATLQDSNEFNIDDTFGKLSKMEIDRGINEELQFLKDKMSNLSMKLESIQTTPHPIPTPVTNNKTRNYKMDMTPTPDDCSGDDSATKIASLEQTTKKLKAQLEVTLANAARIADERDLLMDLNNSLHAELHRSSQGASIAQQYPDLGSITNKVHPENPQMAGPVASKISVHQDTSPRKTLNTIQELKPRRTLQVQGSLAKYHERENSVEDVIHKGTSSQHSRLKSLIRKQEEIRRQEEIHATKPKLRNYNIRDDNVV